MSTKENLISNIEKLLAAYGGPVKVSLNRAMLSIGLSRSHATQVGRLISRRSGFSIDFYDRVVQAFSDAWPTYLPWPEGVVRPEPSCEGHSHPRDEDTAA